MLASDWPNLKKKRFTVTTLIQSLQRHKLAPVGVLGRNPASLFLLTLMEVTFLVWVNHAFLFLYTNASFCNVAKKIGHQLMSLRLFLKLNFYCFSFSNHQTNISHYLSEIINISIPLKISFRGSSEVSLMVLISSLFVPFLIKFQLLNSQYMLESFHME